MNAFDAVVCGFLLIAVVMGYQSGLLRSVATIFGYVCAMPISVMATPQIVAFTAHGHSNVPNWLILSVLFFGVGALLGAALRMTVRELTGPDVSIPDRLAGAMLGATRTLLVAVMMVLIFDRMLPPGVQPGFLVGSRLRPVFSEAGARGLRTLPPDVEEYIDRMKRQRGI